DPLNVLWSPTGEIKLLNIGASLGIPSYQCGIPGCPVPASRDEVGPSAATYYLGLLLLQLTRKECPLQAVNSTQSKYGDHPTLQDLVDEPEIPPHFRSILARMLQQVPDYRYSSLKWLMRDLSDTTAFMNSLSTLRSASEESTTWYTLQDFVSFRLKVISRNPGFQDYPPIKRAHSMLADLSDSLALLPASMLSNWRVYLRMHPQLPIFPSGFQGRRLSPEGRRLLAIAEGWEEARARLQLDRHPPTSLAKLCLYYTLAIEVSACLIACVTASSDITQSTVAEMNEVVLGIIGELKGNSSATFTVHSSSHTPIAMNAGLSADDLQQLQQFISWLNCDYTPHHKQANSLKAVGLFLVLFGFGCELLRDGRHIASSRPVLRLNRVRLSESNLWQLLKDFAVLDEEISHFEGTCLNDSDQSMQFYVQQAVEAWTRIPETITFIQGLNPSKRWAAELYSYGYWENDGLVRLTFPHRGKLHFCRPEVFLSGYLIKERDARRPVRVDVSDGTDKRKRTICSVLAPSQYFRALPLSERKVSPAQIANWMRKHPYLRFLALTAVGMGSPSVIIGLFSLMSGTRVPLVITGAFDVLASISLNLLSSTIQGFLATRHPEDARLVEQ
ncbi:MAG TPA: hypothetical protein VMY80_09060, partial [Anaerolineae bacterium]|nr:hypothetical protein [Anaerolineae bacterium]